MRERHAYRYSWRTWFRRQCTCGKRSCAIADAIERERNPDGLVPW